MTFGQVENAGHRISPEQLHSSSAWWLEKLTKRQVHGVFVLRCGSFLCSVHTWHRMQKAFAVAALASAYFFDDLRRPSGPVLCDQGDLSALWQCPQGRHDHTKHPWTWELMSKAKRCGANPSLNLKSWTCFFLKIEVIAPSNLVWALRWDFIWTTLDAPTKPMAWRHHRPKRPSFGRRTAARWRHQLQWFEIWIVFGVFREHDLKCHIMAGVLWL